MPQKQYSSWREIPGGNELDKKLNWFLYVRGLVTDDQFNRWRERSLRARASDRRWNSKTDLSGSSFLTAEIPLDESSGIPR